MSEDHKQKIQKKIKAIIELSKKQSNKVDWANHKKVETSLSKVIKTQEQADFFMMCLKALTKKKIEPLEDGSTGQPDWDWNNSAMCLKCHQKFSFEDIEEHKNECEK